MDTPLISNGNGLLVSEGWTDQVNFVRPSVNGSSAGTNDTDESDWSVSNTDGDGRFDNNTVPTDSSGATVELAVGRVDMSRMYAFANDFGPTELSGLDLEIALLRRYLDKDHAYRHGAFTVPSAIIYNPGGGDDLPGQPGSENETRAAEWRNFSATVGYENVGVANWFYHMDEPEFAALFASATRSTADHRSLTISDGIIDNPSADPELQVDRATLISHVAARQNLTVFHALSGSYFVDWNKDDNFMRAFVANDGYGLTALWNRGFGSDLHLQHMGLGDTIGFANLISQVGFTGNASAEVWRGLIGDPTLRMHVVKPPSNVQASLDGSDVLIEWDASPIDNVNGSEPSDDFIGYNVYRAASFDGPFVQVGSTTTNLQIVDDAGSLDDVYMVRALRREVVPSGSYINASQGAFWKNSWEAATELGVNFGGSATGVFEDDSPPGSHSVISSSIPVATTGTAIENGNGSVTFGTPSGIFQTARYGATAGSSISLNISVPASERYTVRLYFAEIEAGVEVGERIFDISVEGKSLEDYDIMAEVGVFRGVVKSFSVEVGLDGILDVDLIGETLTGVDYGPLLSAIEIVAVST